MATDLTSVIDWFSRYVLSGRLSNTLDTAGEFPSASVEAEVGQDRGLSEGINSGLRRLCRIRQQYDSGRGFCLETVDEALLQRKLEIFNTD
jgi:hypothetical protein